MYYLFLLKQSTKQPLIRAHSNSIKKPNRLPIPIYKYDIPSLCVVIVIVEFGLDRIDEGKGMYDKEKDEEGKNEGENEEETLLG